jgi:hypothetical protein
MLRKAVPPTTPPTIAIICSELPELLLIFGVVEDDDSLMLDVPTKSADNMLLDVAIVNSPPLDVLELRSIDVLALPFSDILSADMAEG